MGRAGRWATALEESGLAASVTLLVRDHDEIIDDAPRGRVRHVSEEAWRSLPWQAGWMLELAERHTHVLLEDGEAVLGTLNGGRASGDLPFLRSHGINAAVVLSDSRRARSAPACEA